MGDVGRRTIKAGIEVQGNGTDQGKKARNNCCLACSSIDEPETTVLITKCDMNLDQYYRDHFVDC